MNFCILVYFKSWQNRARVDYRALDSETIFVCLGAVWNSEVFDGDFVPRKNDSKHLYVQRKFFIINAIDQGILATSKTLAVNNVPIWITLMACSPDAGHWGNSHRIRHIWRNQGKLQNSTGSPKVSSRGLIPLKRTCTINIWCLCVGRGGGASLRPHHTNAYKFFATLRSYVLASFQQTTFKFGSIVIYWRSFQRSRWIFLYLSMSRVKRNIERSIARRIVPDLEQWLKVLAWPMYCTWLFLS